MSKKPRRWTEKELIALYKSGIRNFRQADLRGLSFREADLLGADFTGADVRATDFTKAKLVGANFRDARMGGTRWSVFWTVVCCVVLAGFSASAFSEVKLDAWGGNILKVSTASIWGCLVFEAIAYTALTAFFILKSPPPKRLATGITVLVITLVASISIFMTATASNFVGMLIALMIGALLLGIWAAALMTKHYSKPGIDLVGLVGLFIIINILSIASASLLPLGTKANDSIILLHFVCRLCFNGFFGCYFLAAAATTFNINRRPQPLNPAVWVSIALGLLFWFLFNLWLKLTPVSAFDQYMTLSVGGTGLISTMLIATHLSLPGNLAKGRFPWLFQGFTSFHQADITGTALSDVRSYAAQTKPRPMKPFHRYWYLLALLASLATSGMLVSQVTLDDSSRSQLSPQRAIALLHNVPSLQQRILPQRENPVQPEANNTTETQAINAGSLNPDSWFGMRGNGIALNGDGSLLAIGTTHSVSLWSLPSGKFIRSFKSYSNYSRALYFTEDSQHLIDIPYIMTRTEEDTGETDIYGSARDIKEEQEIIVWDIASGEKINKIEQGHRHITIADDVAITFGPDPKQPQQQDIYTGNDVQRFPALSQITENSEGWGDFLYLSDDRSLLIDLSQEMGLNVASYGIADKVVTWNLQTGTRLNEFDPAGKGIPAVSPSGRSFAIYYNRDRHRYLTGEESAYFESRPDYFVDIWDIATQSIAHTFPTLSDVEHLKISKNDNVVIAYSQNALQVRDLQQNKTFLFPTVIPINRNRRLHIQGQAVAVSDDGQTIATFSSSGDVALIWHLPQQ